MTDETADRAGAPPRYMRRNEAAEYLSTNSCTLDPVTGKPSSDGSECRLIRGQAVRLRLASVIDSRKSPVELYKSMRPRDRQPGRQVQPPAGTLAVTVVMARNLSTAPKGSIARTLDFLEFKPGRPGYLLIDLDFKGITET